MAHATGRDWDVTPPDHTKSEYGFSKEITNDVGDVQILQTRITRMRVCTVASRPVRLV